MTMSSGARNSSRSDGLCYAPFTLVVFLLKYDDYLGTMRFDEIPLNDDAETIYNTCDGLISIQRWTSCPAIGRIEKNAA